MRLLFLLHLTHQFCDIVSIQVFVPCLTLFPPLAFKDAKQYNIINI